MPKSTQIAENAFNVPTARKNWDGQPVFEIAIDGKVVGEIYRSTHTTPIMAKGANYSVGSRVRKGWEWRVKRSVGVETGMINHTFRRTTSYLLFSSKVKAGTDLVELIQARRGAQAKVESGR
jgi:hypothetical protein